MGIRRTSSLLFVSSLFSGGLLCPSWPLGFWKSNFNSSTQTCLSLSNQAFDYLDVPSFPRHIPTSCTREHQYIQAHFMFRGIWISPPAVENSLFTSSVPTSVLMAFQLLPQSFSLSCKCIFLLDVTTINLLSQSQNLHQIFVNHMLSLETAINGNSENVSSADLPLTRACIAEL